MAFIQAYIKNPTRSIANANKAAGTATTSGLVYDYVAGLLVAATSSSTRQTIAGVAHQTITAAEALTQCPLLERFANDVWIADSTNNSDPLHNGQNMILGANAGVLNNTGTTNTSGVVQQVDVFGVPANKKILVKFNPF